MILFYKFLEILILFFFIPTIVIISLFKPIKIGYIKSRHLGTYATPLEILKCEKKIIYGDGNALYIWFKDKRTDNVVLFNKLINKDLILPSFILKPLFQFFFNKLSLKEKYIIPFRYLKKNNFEKLELWQTRDIHSVLNKLPSTVKLNQNEEEFGKKYLLLKKIDEKKNFVCFSNRGSAYKDEKVQSIRNASILTQIKSINYLLKNNYVAFRMGRNENTKLQENLDKNIIDYAFDDSNKSDILDLFLHSKSNFIISNSGGINNFATIFRKPKFVVDFTQFNDLNTENSYFFPLLIPKIFRKIINKKKIKFSEVFNLGLDKLNTLENLNKLGYEILDNNEDEIFEGTKEMLDIVNNNNIYSNNNQKKFWDMVNEYSPNMGKFKVSEYFFNKNKDLFD